jgi:GNAT superfamily N-acetyltransferase
MADTEPISIVELGVSDAPAGLLLSSEAHWNQNEADWKFFLTHGPVYGVRDDSGQLVATAALLFYTHSNAWISMVLVTESRRRRGLATRLIDACLEAAREHGVTPWLDATPAGATVYAPLGFTPTLKLLRLRREASTPPKQETPQPLSQDGFYAFVARDRHIMGFDRGTLLAELSGRPGSRLVSRDHAACIVRDGRKNRHIGPLFADKPEAALAMIDEIISSETGPWLIDAVSTQEEFLRGLTGSGWSVERPFQRMRFGSALTKNTELPFAVAGPEFG